MKQTVTGLSVLLTLTLGACIALEPFDPSLRGQQAYLCCNLRFNQDRDASDANYAYEGVSTLVPVGTRVTVVDVGYTSITLWPQIDTRRFYLDLRFGTKQQTPKEYFAKILCDTDPLPALASAPTTIQSAVREGRLIDGMTKEQAIMARGYPPLHRTAGVESDEWIYYQSRGFVDRVRFVDGKIAGIERGNAPD